MVTPYRPIVLLKTLTVDPNSERDATTWSPLFKVGRHSVRMAAIPEAVAEQNFAPSMRVVPQKCAPSG